ncbi:hypothetical protein BU16DRAFT_500052 [Lophium mytilinum]|uniref:Mitochondrial outer membrane transport complex Sam37/metaxin N-terminal domain-containing protein n=1 Tax=Lophium mytilinum TaxID=390894 RepID=A0A6A6R945_9PEZI|nr:hypothetical protein BU16DRAFT_500052 [Lophium mytilinum]
MVFELHVWGPAFGLPSIDAECNAAIAFLNLAVARSQWVLIVAHDTSPSPTHNFPALRDGSTCIGGFNQIVQYLSQHPSGPHNLDSNLTSNQKADTLAFSTFIETTGRPLLDLSLYTSSQNYSTTTAPAYTALLPWNLNYTIPPRHRDAARARTAHLGLSGLDVDSDLGTSLGGEFEAAKKASGLPSDSHANRPSILNLGRQTGLQGLLSSPVYAARFKLDALANEFLTPLSDLLGRKQYLLGGDAPSTLDSLAFGYLALMLYPPVPQTWLKEAIEARYLRLEKYIRRMRTALLGNDEDVSPSKVFALASWPRYDAALEHARQGLGLALPWAPPRTTSLAATAFTVARDIVGSFPAVSTLIRGDPVRRDRQSEDIATIPTSALPSPFIVNTFFAFSGALLSAIAGMAVHHARSPRQGDLVFELPRRRPQQTFAQAGDFLGVLTDQIRAERDWNERWQREGSGGDGGLGAEEAMGVVDEVVVEGVGER